MKNTFQCSGFDSQISTRLFEESIETALNQADRRGPAYLLRSLISPLESESKLFFDAARVMKALFLGVLCMVATAAHASTIVWTGTNDSRCGYPYHGCGTSSTHVYLNVHWAGVIRGDRWYLYNDRGGLITILDMGPGSGSMLVDQGVFSMCDCSPGTYEAADFIAARAGSYYYGDQLPASGGDLLNGVVTAGTNCVDGCPPAGPPGALTLDIYVGSAIPPSAYEKPCDKKEGGDQCANCGGMARYSAHAMATSLNIVDTPIRYTPPRGPAIDFTVTYNQRDDQQPTSFAYPNFGPKWTFNWLSYVTDNPDPNYTSADRKVCIAGGGTEVYSGFASSSQSLPDSQSHAVLVRISTTPIKYERRFPDGSKEVYSQSDNSSSYPRKVFMTEVWDAAGNQATIDFHSPTSLQIDSITDALGYKTALSYDPGVPLRIIGITEPEQFRNGTSPLRSATFSYGNGQLTTITDEIGIQSIFTYTPGTDSIDSLTTPYGTSHFASGQNGSNRWLEMTDSMGGKERVEYRDNAPGIGGSESVAPAGMTNSGLDAANTFYWDKKYPELYPPTSYPYDYTKAKIIHWAKNSGVSVSGIAASEKAPLENRVWYAYAGQSDTNQVGSSANRTKVARVLDDGTTAQLWQYEYNNSVGKITKSTDPKGRVLSYIYHPNDIDLKEVRQTTGSSNELLRAMASYNSLHEPLIDTDAAGQSTIYTYNSYGQVTSLQNAKNETTTYTYGDGTSVPTGYLASITSPLFNGASAITTFAYDSANRVHTVTNNPDNYQVTTDYDNLDRPTQITYPDGTTQQFQYTQLFGAVSKTILDLTASKDRLGHWTTRYYNGNRQMDSITDPLGHSNLYDWCKCGSLTGITDPNGNVTTFNRDLQSRVKSKVFANNSTINYIYENTTSRLKSMTDALNQIANYSYFTDDNIQQISYTNAVSPTPTVNYIYDPNFNRVTSMTDGVGTTNYLYYSVASGTLGAGKLHQVDGPFSNDTITYGYDELGRVLSQDINGTGSTASYDSLGRLGTTTNVLGSFGHGYDGVTPRLATLTYPSGQTASYSYFGNDIDRRLKTLRNSTSPTAVLSKFDYTYDAEGEIQTTSALGNAPPLPDTPLDYDDAKRLTRVTKGSITGEGDYGFQYGYDAAGNRLSDLSFDPYGNSSGKVYTANNLNQLDSVSNKNGNSQTAPVAIPYDANGNMKYDGTNQSFEWDAANRLVAINYSNSGNRTEFGYDGLGRRVRITEYGPVTATPPAPVHVPPPPLPPPGPVVGLLYNANGTRAALTAKTFVWCGNQICEERDSTGQIVTKRFFAEGEQRLSGSDMGLYYYTRDHLGSVHELTDAVGNLKARYNYGAWGNETIVSGNMTCDFGFTGHYIHQPSGLNLSLYRAYNPTIGRWISRDPLENAEISQGPNLYAYVGNNPTVLRDPLGLLWYEDLATWSRTRVDAAQTWLDFHLPWQVAGIADTALELINGVASTPDAISHLGEGAGAWSADPSWETSSGLFMDISLTSGVLAGGLAPTEIGNASLGLKGRLGQGGWEITFTRPGANTPDLRINPCGGSGYPPHYHRRPGIGKHRPWQGGW